MYLIDPYCPYKNIILLSNCSRYGSDYRGPSRGSDYSRDMGGRDMGRDMSMSSRDYPMREYPAAQRNYPPADRYDKE